MMLVSYVSPFVRSSGFLLRICHLERRHGIPVQSAVSTGDCVNNKYVPFFYTFFDNSRRGPSRVISAVAQVLLSQHLHLCRMS